MQIYKKVVFQKSTLKCVNKHKHIFIKSFYWSQSWAPLLKKTLNDLAKDVTSKLAEKEKLISKKLFHTINRNDYSQTCLM